MKLLLSRRFIGFGCVLLVALFLVHPPASRLQDRVSRSISAALGRNVEISSLHIRFLPRPSFEISDLIIHDDPRFGAEPLVRAPEVTASLQISALLRGHIQIAGLNLKEASLNLTRNSSGEWNLADLLQRSSSITVAPTAASRHSAAKTFPYIQASGTRVNFKIGEEKTHFALTDATLALWQDSENTWGMRVEAQPIRTDANLTGTGIVALNATWQRSMALRQTPLHLTYALKRAQLGQVSKLIYGSDSGWRGGVVLSGEMNGTPENLDILADGSVDDFRGPDVLSGNDLRLAARCSAEYSFSAKTLSNVDCLAPSGSGLLELKGSLSAGVGSMLQLFGHDLPGNDLQGYDLSSYDVRLFANNMPAQSMLLLANHARPSLASGLAAQGRTNANIRFSRSDAGVAQIRGSGEIQDLHLASASGSDLAVGTVPFSISAGGLQSPVRSRLAARRIQPSASQELISTAQSGVEIGPFSFTSGKASALQVHGFLSLSGYQGSIRGDTRVKALLQAARAVSIPAPAVNADGNSNVDLVIAGTWDSSRPKITGNAQLHSVDAQVRGINGPINISKANLVLGADAIRVQNLTATAADAIWHGSLRIPRPCATARDCELQFNLRTSQLSASALNAYFNPAMQKKNWYRFLGLSSDQPRYLLQARASGTIAVENLVLGSTTCSHFTAGLHLAEGRLALSHLTGEVLDGKISGTWEASFNANPPEYKGNGEVQSVSLAEASELMHDGWIEGTADAKYEFSATGRSLREVLDSSDLNLNFSIADAAFPHIAFTTASGPLLAENFSGTAQLRAGEISFNDAKLETAGGVYTLSGTASLSGVLNLRLAGDGIPSYLVSGTILETRVAANPTTAASLKP